MSMSSPKTLAKDDSGEILVIGHFTSIFGRKFNRKDCTEKHIAPNIIYYIYIIISIYIYMYSTSPFLGMGVATYPVSSARPLMGNLEKFKDQQSLEGIGAGNFGAAFLVQKSGVYHRKGCLKL